MIHLDTHVAIWIYDRRVQNLSGTAQRLLRSETIMLSPMALFEYEILLEKGRFRDTADALFADLREQTGLTLSETAFDTIVDRARRFAWTRDPFDRLIVANAIADGARLITADQSILENFADAVW
ncbi:MAG: PIN domain-containing protein [Pseudomonadota bacterium]|nr:PIN domain-containing protein [Pseudomonadota bacterium]